MRAKAKTIDEIRSALETHLRAGMPPSEIASAQGLCYDADENAVVLPGWWADDGSAALETDAATAPEAAEQYARGGDWGHNDATIWTQVQTWQVGMTIDDDGEVEEVRIGAEWHTVALDPDAPKCARGRSHEWTSPHSVLGGCEENPGVWGSGGGVVHTEVCRNCAAYRTTDTWAQCPATGEQGLRSVEYQDADDRSRAWLDEQE